MYATRLTLDELNQDSFSRIQEANPQFARLYMWSVVVAGWLIILFSASPSMEAVRSSIPRTRRDGVH